MVQLRILYNSVLLLTTTVSCRRECGKIGKRSHRIYGGKEVDIFYPWFMAFVRIPINRLQPAVISIDCGGSLITQRDVLTAAHCLTEREAKNNFVVFSGLEGVCQPAPNGAYHKILRTVIHQKYSGSAGAPDIAIATLTDNVNSVPVCLPKPKGRIPRRAEVIGYGYINDNYDIPCKLQTVDVKIHRQRVCRRILREYGFPPLDNVICAGDLGGGLDSCQGDSGGPLQVSKNATYTIYGIVSFGFGCALPDTLGFYVDVSKFVNWIEKFAYDKVVLS